MTVRAIEHIGITVPDLEQATVFFAEAFESGLGVPEGATIGAIRMLRLGEGPDLELVTYPSLQAYKAGTPLRRRRPPATSDHTRQEP